MAVSKAKRPKAGYCHYHKKALTFKDIREKGCVDRKKQRGKEICSYLAKYDHPLWEDKELKKLERKVAKTLKKLMKEGE